MKDDAQPPDDANGWLAAIAQRRDKHAFIELFHYFAPRIKAYLRRQGLEAVTAEDLTQDVMLQIWSRAAQFDARKARPSTWIFTIARNRLVDFWRREKEVMMTVDDPALEGQLAHTPHDGLDAAKDGATLHTALETLPPEQRDLIEQSYFHDQPHSAMARARKIPLGTVKSRLRLALDHLRKNFKKRAMP